MQGLWLHDLLTRLVEIIALELFFHRLEALDIGVPLILCTYLTYARVPRFVSLGTRAAQTSGFFTKRISHLKSMVLDKKFFIKPWVNLLAIHYSRSAI